MMGRRKKKPRMRQLRLGASETNSLTLIGLPYRKRRGPYDEVDVELFAELPFPEHIGDELLFIYEPPFPILGLPEELVENIFKIAAWTDYCRSYRQGAEYRALHSLSLACKYFRRLVTPILYTSAALRLQNRHHEESKLLLRSLVERPTLATNLRSLYLIVYQLNSKIWQETDAFKKYLTNIRYLSIVGQYHENEKMGDCMAEFLVRTLPYMTGVREFKLETDLSYFEYGFSEHVPQEVLPAISLQSLCTAMDHMRHLRVLTIRGFNPEHRVPKILEGTSPVISLTLEYYKGSLAGLTEFLKWPSGLEYVSLSHIRKPRGHNIHEFRDVFKSHKHSLKSLHLPDIIPQTGPIKLSDFQSLETLHISGCTMTDSWDPGDVCSKILSAPRLQRLVLSLTKWDEYEGEWFSHMKDFRPEQMVWLSNVVWHAHAQKCALREVEIQFNPTDVRECQNGEDLVPLRLMDQLAVEMEQFGMTLIYKRYTLKKDLVSYNEYY